jgi:hypothetical protein
MLLLRNPLTRKLTTARMILKVVRVRMMIQIPVQALTLIPMMTQVKTPIVKMMTQVKTPIVKMMTQILVQMLTLILTQVMIPVMIVKTRTPRMTLVQVTLTSKLMEVTTHPRQLMIVKVPMIRTPLDRVILSSLLMAIALIPVHLLVKKMIREKMIHLRRTPALVVNQAQTKVVIVRPIHSQPMETTRRDQRMIALVEVLILNLLTVMIHRDQVKTSLLNSQVVEMTRKDLRMIAQVEGLILSRPMGTIRRDQPTVPPVERMIPSNQLVPLLIVLALVMTHNDRQVGLVTVHRDLVIQILQILRQLTPTRQGVLTHNSQLGLQVIVLVLVMIRNDHQVGLILDHKDLVIHKVK